MKKKKHIIILGAGFGGLKLARSLNNDSHYRITLIDKNNYHQFQPLLYQVATASLDESNIAFPLRHIFQKSTNVRIRLGEVTALRPEENLLETSEGILSYDYLVIATGAGTNYFGNDHLQRYTFPMKSIVEALQLRNRLLQNFEAASVTSDEVTLEKLLHVVIVGGGPTGIELSGAIAEMRQDALPKDYPELNFNRMKIYLLEAGERVLGSMSEISSAKSKMYLEKMGVLVKTSTLVKDYDGNRVLLQDGSHILSALVIWAAGVKGMVPDGISKELVAPGNRIKVDLFSKVQGSKNIFAIGDVAYMESEKYPKGFPQLANVAIDQAKNVALNFRYIALGKPLRMYEYRKKGSMATIGRKKAVVDLVKPPISFQGVGAWLIWMTVHLFLLIGFKNRIMVFINWTYKYFERDQSLSLMFTTFTKKNKVPGRLTDNPSKIEV